MTQGLVSFRRDEAPAVMAVINSLFNHLIDEINLRFDEDMKIDFTKDAECYNFHVSVNGKTIFYKSTDIVNSDTAAAEFLVKCIVSFMANNIVITKCNCKAN